MAESKTSEHETGSEHKTGPKKPSVQSATDKITETAKSAQKLVVDKASDAGRTATQALDSSPLAALAGAIAIGAVAAAFIPTSRREIEALGPWAEKLRDAAEEAFKAARDAGTGELTAAGLTVAAASDGLGGVVGKIVKAATASAAAAASSVKQARTASTGNGADATDEGTSTPPSAMADTSDSTATTGAAGI